MPGFGSVPCRVVASEPHERFVYTFNEYWTLTWRLVPEGDGTRLLLEHSGFDLDDHRQRDACERMGPGWRDTVLPRLAELAEDDSPLTAACRSGARPRSTWSSTRSA